MPSMGLESTTPLYIRADKNSYVFVYGYLSEIQMIHPIQVKHVC